MKAAKKVFSLYPYTSASMRMIANEARVDHPLIIYYFSTKAALFDTVMKAWIEQSRQEVPNWFSGLSEMDLPDAVSAYLDRALSFHFKHPEIYRIILLNMTQSAKKEGRVPYAQIIGDTINLWSELFTSRSRFKIKPEQVGSFIRCISLLMLNLIGAQEYHAEIQGMAPKSDEYLRWVKKQIMFIVVPVLISFESEE
ncbi:MAG: TetR/AcrR family transcriptional regulator [Deltaproteobacteria bacterium]|nr:TetR/AcrR family transcriptional regulator [Deltaproteobacteria bacterium]